VKIRLYFLVVLFLLDLFLAPLVLDMPNYLKSHGIKAGAGQWKQDILEKPWGGPLILITDGKVRTAWLWTQPILAGIIISIYTRNVQRRKKKGDAPGGPPAAGEGQFGTSRWQTEDEINTNFKMVTFPMKGTNARWKE